MTAAQLAAMGYCPEAVKRILEIIAEGQEGQEGRESMKVKLEKDYRKLYTLEQVDQARAVVQCEKENDDFTVMQWAEMAGQEAAKRSGVCAADWMDGWILKADATTARNGRAWNLYGEGTGDMDVWIDAVVRTGEGFLEVGAYLSDIWQTGGTDYSQHMYIKRYARVEA